MKAVVYEGPFDVKVEEVDDPRIEAPTDAIVRITSTCICGSDLHMYEGRTQAEPGIVFGRLFEKGLSLHTGQCNVKRYNRYLRDLIVAGRARPSLIVSNQVPLDAAPDAYDKFDRRVEGYTKVILKPAA